jgi:hypothetical protein
MLAGRASAQNILRFAVVAAVSISFYKNASASPYIKILLYTSQVLTLIVMERHRNIEAGRLIWTNRDMIFFTNYGQVIS